MVGHQFGNNDHPYCQNEDGTWTADSTITTLDFEDAKSPLSGWRIIDRHGCTLVDANLDGIDDIVCVNGANFHTSLDYPELYLTMPDGTLQKVRAAFSARRSWLLVPARAPLDVVPLERYYPIATPCLGPFSYHSD